MYVDMLTQMIIILAVNDQLLIIKCQNEYLDCVKTEKKKESKIDHYDMTSIYLRPDFPSIPSASLNYTI